MTLYDYYEPKKYNQITYECSAEIKSRKSTKNPIDAFIALLNLYMEDEQFRENYPIDNNGCLFYLLCKYATDKNSRQRIITMPQVTSFESKKNTHSISTTLGDAEFELYLKNILDIALKFLETDVRKLKILIDLYRGNLYQYCHYSVAELGKNYNIICAFVPGKFANHRFLHSYLERDNTIYDVSNNLLMSKDEYYSLLTPEEVLTMSGEQLSQLLKQTPDERIEDVYFDCVEKVLQKKK